MSQDTLSISELNQLIKDVISAGVPRSMWVCGEVQNFRRNKHCYFELVEKDEVTKGVKAKINVAIWMSLLPKIDAVLKKAENGFELKDGIEVRLLGRVDYYTAGGSLSFIVDNIDPVYTLGMIAQDRQRLIAELTKSGSLAKNKALDFPLVPLRVGLVTAVDSAAYNDFMDELKDSGYSFQVSLARAAMQGKECEASVCQALGSLNAQKDLDVIVITRGGGSAAELSCFDSKAIALTVSGMRYPVLTGIGHEINTTVTDLAAHTFLKTPTAAAQWLVQRTRDFMDGLADGYQRLLEAADARTSEEMGVIREAAYRMQRGTEKLLRDRRSEVVRVMECARHRPVAGLKNKRILLADRQEQLKKIIHLRMQTVRTKMSNVEKVVQFASPVKILRRGFSVTRTDEGKLVRSPADVASGNVITTELLAGKLVSRVEGSLKEAERG